MTRRFVCALLSIAIAGLAAQPAAQRKHQNEIIDLWMAGKTAFGVFVPNEASRPATGARPTPSRSTRKPGARSWPQIRSTTSCSSISRALRRRRREGDRRRTAQSRTPTSRKTLIVRVPAFHEDPPAGRARIREVFAAGGDGITFPHVESLDEAQQILAAVRAGEDRRLVARDSEWRKARDDDD